MLVYHQERYMNISYLKALTRGNVSLNVGIISRTQVTAHRGFSKVAPENTLPAFQAAMDCGADYIELDIQLTADDQLVVIHDDKLDSLKTRVWRKEAVRVKLHCTLAFMEEL